MEAPETTSASLFKTEQLDGIGYLFGRNISHSFSPLLHGTVYEGLGLNWQQFLLDSGDVTQFLQLLQEPKCFGMFSFCQVRMVLFPGECSRSATISLFRASEMQFI